MNYKDYLKRKIDMFWMDIDRKPNKKERRLLAKQARARVRKELHKAVQKEEE